MLIWELAWSGRCLLLLYFTEERPICLLFLRRCLYILAAEWLLGCALVHFDGLTSLESVLSDAVDCIVKHAICGRWQRHRRSLCLFLPGREGVILGNDTRNFFNLIFDVLLSMRLTSFWFTRGRNFRNPRDSWSTWWLTHLGDSIFHSHRRSSQRRS